MATTRNWLGGQHDFFAASSWTPAGQPAAGDTAIIGLGAGNVAMAQNATLTNLAVVLDDGASTADPTANPTLSLSNAVIASNSSIQAQAVFDYNPNPFLETINLKGFVLNQGAISEVGLFNTLDVNLAHNTVLANQGGTISAADFDTLKIEGSGRGALLNNGTISGQGSTIDIGTPVFGQGAFNLTDSSGFNSHSPNPSTLEFHRMVGSGQTISLSDSTLVLDSPATFLGTIHDVSVNPTGPFGEYPPNSSVLLKGEQATGLSFQNNVLTVSNGSSVLAQLSFTPGLTAADFVLNNVSGGGNLPGGANIGIQLPAAGAASTQMAQTASISVPPLQNQA